MCLHLDLCYLPLPTHHISTTDDNALVSRFSYNPCMVLISATMRQSDVLTNWHQLNVLYSNWFLSSGSRGSDSIRDKSDLRAGRPHPPVLLLLLCQCLIHTIAQHKNSIGFNHHNVKTYLVPFLLKQLSWKESYIWVDERAT